MDRINEFLETDLTSSLRKCSIKVAQHLLDEVIDSDGESTMKFHLFNIAESPSTELSELLLLHG